MHVKRQPRPVPRLQADLAETLSKKAESSIGNVRVKLRHKKQAVAAAGTGEAAGGAGAGQHITLHVQVGTNDTTCCLSF